MSIRLDPRRVSTLKRLAAEAGVRPGDLVRVWVEERLDADRGISPGPSLASQVAALAARIEALEAATSRSAKPEVPVDAPAVDVAVEALSAAVAAAVATDVASEPANDAAAEAVAAAATRTRKTKKATAAPRHKPALHDEMIAVLAERGPMTAADLAAAVVERGRYTPPRSGKPIDAAMISQRVSNPTYRARFTRNEGRIGLAG